MAPHFQWRLWKTSATCPKKKRETAHGHSKPTTDNEQQTHNSQAKPAHTRCARARVSVYRKQRHVDRHQAGQSRMEPGQSTTGMLEASRGVRPTHVASMQQQ